MDFVGGGRFAATLPPKQYSEGSAPRPDPQPFSCLPQRFQEVEESHLQHLKSLVGSYIHSVEDTHVQIGQVGSPGEGSSGQTCQATPGLPRLCRPPSGGGLWN